MSGSVVDLLEAEAEQAHQSARRIAEKIEQAERDLVKLRDQRDEWIRLAVEARAGANMLRDIGLRSSMVNGAPLLEVDYTPKRPAA